MSRLKDSIYNFVVRKNDNVRYEYERYVMEHIVEHYEHRLTHWKILRKLVWHYRIKKKTIPLLYKENRTPKSPGRVLPYLDGAESIATKRTKMQFWVKGLFEYDVISFDIFDTLLLRNLNKPRDLFMILGERFDIIDFWRIRFSAEVDARKKHQALYGNREINIYDIYDLIEKRTGLNAKVGIETEFELECEICYANPYMKEAYAILHSKGLPIYMVSDMYWPKEYLIKLLKKNGYKNYEDVLVSCDYKGNKTNGFLFKALIMRTGLDKKIVHIGDNKQADVSAAESFGLATRYYANVQTCGDIYRENGMSPLIRATYRGIVNAHLHNGMEKYTEQYEYGFIFGGLFVLGYVNWIHEQAKRRGIKKILFIARDGYIYKKIYDKLFSDIPSYYVFWSRVASLKYACEYERQDFLTIMIDHKFGQDISISSMLKSLDLQEMIPLLSQYDLRPEELIHSGNKESLSSFFVENWELLLSIQKPGQEQAEKYYKSIIGTSDAIALVDIGWRGDNQLGLKKLIQKNGGLNVKFTILWQLHLRLKETQVIFSRINCYVICFQARIIGIYMILSTIKRQFIWQCLKCFHKRRIPLFQDLVKVEN